MSPGHCRRPNTAWTEGNCYATFFFGGGGSKQGVLWEICEWQIQVFSSYEFSRETARETVKKAEDQNK